MTLPQIGLELPPSEIGSHIVSAEEIAGLTTERPTLSNPGGSYMF